MTPEVLSGVYDRLEDGVRFLTGLGVPTSMFIVSQGLSPSCVILTPPPVFYLFFSVRTVQHHPRLYFYFPLPLPSCTPPHPMSPVGSVHPRPVHL